MLLAIIIIIVFIVVGLILETDHQNFRHSEDREKEHRERESLKSVPNK